jgi:hypothetical protein
MEVISWVAKQLLVFREGFWDTELVSGLLNRVILLSPHSGRHESFPPNIKSDRSKYFVWWRMFNDMNINETGKTEYYICNEFKGKHNLLVWRAELETLYPSVNERANPMLIKAAERRIATRTMEEISSVLQETYFFTNLLYIICRICNKCICSISTGSWMSYAQWRNSYIFLLFT